MATIVAVVDFDPDEDDHLDEDPAAAVDDLSYVAPPVLKLRSTITAAGDAKKTKGRGFRESKAESHSHRRLADLTSDGGPGPGPQRSIEGWIVLVTGVHEEAQEDHLHEAFREYGQIKNLRLSVDRRTGFVKSYALIEYENFDEAQAAIRSLDGSELLTQTIYVDWAFSKGSFKRRNMKSLIVFPVFMRAHISQLLYEHRCVTRLQEIPSTSYATGETSVSEFWSNPKHLANALRTRNRALLITCLSQKGHFKGMPFHRVIKHYVIQGGDVHELGAAEDWMLTGKAYSKLDISSKHEAFMPKAKPDNKGFELFITTSPILDLNDKLVVFGRVIKREDVVQWEENHFSGTARS